MSSQLTFHKQGRYKNQSNINHRQPWKSSRWSFLNVLSMLTMMERRGGACPECWWLLVAYWQLSWSLWTPLTLVSALYISHGARSALVSQSLVIAQWTREAWSSGRRVHHQEVIYVRGNKWHSVQGSGEKVTDNYEVLHKFCKVNGVRPGVKWFGPTKYRSNKRLMNWKRVYVIPA